MTGRNGGLHALSTVTPGSHWAPTSPAAPRRQAGRLVRLPAALWRQGIFRNSSYNIGAQIVTGICGFGFWIVAAREGSPASVGLATTLLADAALVGFLSNLGVGPALVLKLRPHDPLADRRREDALISAALFSIALLGTLTGAVMLVGLHFVPHLSHPAGQLAVIIPFLIGGIVWTMLLTGDGLSTGLGRSDLLFWRYVLLGVLKVGFIACIPLLHARVTPSELVGSWAAASAVTLAVLVGWQRMQLVPHYKMTRTGLRPAARSLRRPAGLLYVSYLSANLPQFLLPTLVTVVISASANGFFSTTWLFGSVFFLVSPAVASALFAEVVRDRAAAPLVVRRACQLLIGVLAPLMLVVYLGAHRILSVYGAAYANDHSTLLLRILVVSAIPDAVTNIAALYFRATGRLTWETGLSSGISAVVLATAVPLMRVDGIDGVGYAWLVGQTAGMLAVLVALALGRHRARPRSQPDPDHPSPSEHPTRHPQVGQDGVEPTSPVASVVIPTHNRADQLDASIEAVRRQTVTDIEILVCDDASSDRTAAMVGQIGDPRVRHLRRPHNGGPSHARNLGIGAARAPVVFFTDDDVIVRPDWIARGLEHFRSESVVGVEGKLIYVGEAYDPSYADRVVENPSGGEYMTANAAYRRVALMELGGFDPALRIFEDRDLANRIEQHGEIVFADDVVAVHMVDCHSVRSYMAEARKSVVWLEYNQRRRRNERLWLDHVYEPSKLLALLWPPLVLVQMARQRPASRHDLLLLLLIFPRLAYERMLVWRWAWANHELVL